MSTAGSLAAYHAFLRAKACIAHRDGFEVEDAEIHAILKPHQRAMVRWAVRGGRRGLFASFGLGKSVVQLETLRLVLVHATAGAGRALIIAPLGVRQEFARDAAMLGIELRFVRRTDEVDGPGIYLTNYESVRDGKLDVGVFDAASLDEASCLRGFGGTKTFREFMRVFDADSGAGRIAFRFVATATPSPNDTIELLAYAAFLGVMDVGHAKTRFFKRNSEKADTLTLHPHKEEEFWLWVASWALFVQRPSDLGFSDERYELPPLTVTYHEVQADLRGQDVERDGQGILLRDAAIGVQGAAREKRDTLPARIEALTGILAAAPGEHFIVWHDLEAERHAIDRAVPGAVSIYGAQDLEEREKAIVDFSNGAFPILSAKPVIAGSGCNFQRHCHRAVFLGIGFKFNDFIQACHRIQRFLQSKPVEIHVIYAETEREILRTLQRKWRQHEEMVAKMGEIIRKFGLSEAAMASALTRSIGCARIEVRGENHMLVNADCVEETSTMPDDSIDLIVTSIPFSTQYEYTPSYNDFGHTDNNQHFWDQMDFLIPQLLRVLRPGRVAAIHVKDRIQPGGINGFGFQTVEPFSDESIARFRQHGFAFLARKTIVTDVVRENNQTYRLGWTEQCKDGSRMGAGMPEYLLLFRKAPSDRSNGYADSPVMKPKKEWDPHEGADGSWINPEGYSRARWQIDAHGYQRSSGDRLLRADELQGLAADVVFKAWKRQSLAAVYDFEHHVMIGESLEARGSLPPTFMLLPPHSWHPDVWTDVTRMLTLNGQQHAKGRELHLCPLQFDIVDRAIAQFTMPGETVFDPFGGLMTVPTRALKAGRKGIGIELNPGYFLDGCTYVEAAAREVATPSLFDFLDAQADTPKQAAE
ncbi:DNA methylase N-4 [Methylobacterium fujisawaense]|uniref:DNA methyltransferase n=1 Tax=Methylobacterium fujisawaense TaxID=107400 RepID=UPI002F2E466D